LVEESKLKVINSKEASKIAVMIFKGISEKIEEIKFRIESFNDAKNEQKIGVEKTTEANNFLSVLTQENTESAAKALLTAKNVEEDSNRISLSMNEI
jgi:methyl-accepting chemotaxis protein